MTNNDLLMLWGCVQINNYEVGWHRTNTPNDYGKWLYGFKGPMYDGRLPTLPWRVSSLRDYLLE